MAHYLYTCSHCFDYFFTPREYADHVMNNCKVLDEKIRKMNEEKTSMYNEDLVKYKIHAIDTVAGNRRSANNSVFYDTYDEALAKCQEYLRRGDCVGFVIMKTFGIVRLADPPIREYGVMADDKIMEIGNCDG